MLERGVEAAKALAAAVCGEGGLAVERRQVKVQLVDKVKGAAQKFASIFVCRAPSASVFVCC